MNVAFTSVVTVSAIEFVGESNRGQGVAIATAISTVALLLAGEIVPKTIAVRNAERVAFIYAQPLKWTERLLLPFVLFLQWITRGLNAVLGGSGPESSITEGEFRSLIDIGESEGTFEPSEAEMLEKVFQFGDRHVREVMTPRVPRGGPDGGDGGRGGDVIIQGKRPLTTLLSLTPRPHYRVGDS